MKKYSLIMLFLLSCFLCYGESMNNYNGKKIDSFCIKFYYNSSNDYPDTGRTEKDIENGYYQEMKVLSYNEISNLYDIRKLLSEKPKFIFDIQKTALYKSCVNCLCVIFLEQKEVLRFTYSENTDNFRLCNGRLIEKNYVYDNFSNIVIKNFILR